MTVKAPASSRPERLVRVRVLAVIFLGLSLLGWLRLEQALLFRDLLAQFGAWPGPLYIAAGGAVWGVVGLLAAVALWSRRTWAGIAARAAALVFILTYWVDRIWFSAQSTPVYNWLFSVGVSAAWLVMVYWATSNRATRPVNNRRKGERDDK